MKNKITDKMILKAGAALLSFGILLGSFTWVGSLQVSAADLVHDHETGDEADYLSGDAVAVDPYVTPAYVKGKLHMGTDALHDPAKVTSSQGIYYNPITYIYFGETYSSEQDSSIPVLLRVLDAERDNAGNTGAMFVMTEYADLSSTVFSQYRKYDDEKYYGLFATENVYNLSIPYSLINSYVSDDYRGKLTVHFPNLGEEIDYIRPVTVTDRLAEMEAIYGYGMDYSMHWEVDDRSASSQVYAQDRDEMTYVDNKMFFLLSAKEMYDYVSEVPGTPVMAAKKLGTDEYVSYWLRTGLDFGGSAENGNYVGAVDASGNVIPLDTGETAYLRYGFNIETEDIQFMYKVNDNGYRLTFIDPTYKQAIANADPENGVDDRFTAKLINIQDGVATVTVSNVIRHAKNVGYHNADENLGISIIIKDGSGVVTHYANVVDRIYSNNDINNAGAISREVSTVKFRLPEDIDYENDEIYVFWEMTQPLEESATFISNMVNLGCLHPNATEADCKNPSVCPDCGVRGKIDENNHKGVDSSVYYTNTDNDTHWNICDECGATVNLENCTFGADCSVDCVCGNSDYPADKHKFNENGICEENAMHFESPLLEINKNLRHVTVRITKEGHLIAFARMLNGGEFDESYEFSVLIENDLNFYGIEGFEPIGTEEHPFNGFVSGKTVTIKNLNYSTDLKYAGVFGYASYLEIRYITLESCSFESAEYAGAFVGKVASEDGETLRFDTLTVEKCKINATSENGKEGILVGEACDNISVNNVYSIGVTNGESGVRFFSAPEIYKNISVTRSACLCDERGEYGEYDAAAYASGEVAHLMGKGQRIGEDEYPSTDTPSIDNGTRVFKVSDCSGVTLRYTNEYLSVHYLRDYTEHRITEFYEFVWHEHLPVAEARVYCEACDSELLIEAEMSMTEIYAPVRADYIATIYINGEKFSSEPKRFIGGRIQDMIGMTNKVVEFNGNNVNPEDVLDNHRLVDSPSGLKEYEAYFLDPVTGERITRLEYNYYGQPVYVPSGVYLPGTYDLLVVGLRAYEGQEYIYEDALTITPITVYITVGDVYKYYDGSTSFEAVYSLENDDYNYIFEVVVSDAPSAEVGTYDLLMGIEVWDESYTAGINVVFSRDVVKGYVFPQLQPSVENKNYPTEFTYGDTIPDPKAENFKVSEGCELEFDWFESEYDFSKGHITTQKLDSKPCAAGDYILRVTATSDSFVTYAYELPITINKKQLTLKIEGGEVTVNEYGDKIYVLDMYESLDITIEGFVNGDTAESVGAFVDYYQDSYSLPEINDRYVFPYQPLDGYYGNVYSVRVYGDLVNYLTDDCSYERAYEYIYVIINAPDAPTPIFGDDNLEDGDAKEIGVIYSWNHPISFIEGEIVHLYGTVSEGDAIVEEFELTNYEYLENNVWRMLKITKAGEYSIDIKARYISEYDYIEDYNVNVSFKVEFINNLGEQIEEIRELGDYTVRITSANGEVRELPVTVCREISMQVKPFEYDPITGYPKFDIKNFIMEAGQVVLIGHEIVDVEYEFYYSGGSVSVKSLTVVDSEGRDVSHLYKAAPYRSTTIHVFESPCDSTCDVYGCEYVRATRHSGGVATCTTLAICDVCGCEYGSLQPNRHVSENTVFTPNSEDGMTHNEIYTCCGAIKNTVGHVMAIPATCTTLAVCKDCKWGYGEFDPDNHSSSDMIYAPASDDAASHVATHACCRASFTETHFGGKATCMAVAVCEGCNAGYGEIDASNHTNISYTSIDGQLHAAKCNGCQIEWQESHRGGVATCLNLAKCDVCQASYGELDSDNHESTQTEYVLREENPSMHDHVHSCCGGFISKAYHSGGEANCASAAICEYCSEQYGNKDPENHASDKVTYRQDQNDSSCHVKLHECCGVEIAIEAHGGAGTANCYHGDVCDVCGIEYTEKVGHTYDDANDTQCNVCGHEIEAEVVESIIIEAPESGCKSSLGSVSITVIAVVTALGIVSFKKKEI